MSQAFTENLNSGVLGRFINPDIAFSNAIKSGRLSENEALDNYAGAIYVYVHG